MFKLTDVKSNELQSTITDITMEKAVEAGSSDICCHAINWANNPKKRKRCSQATKKDSNLCHHHSKVLLNGKQVVLIDD
jgi:hypothetical protein